MRMVQIFVFAAYFLSFNLVAQAEFETIQTSVTSREQAFVMFGHGGIVHFNVAEDKALEKSLDCDGRMILETIVNNRQENFNKTERDSKLEWKPVCLRCHVEDEEGYLLEDAHLIGAELKGSYIHYMMRTPPDRFGFQIPNGAKGILKARVSLVKTPCYKTKQE